MDGVWHITTWDLTVRILLSALLGGIIGFEREWNNHAAGFRTHILVCIGSTAIMLLSIYGFADFVYEDNVRLDPARLAAQVISGIGFLGAGAILRNGSTVSGLTTAASIWVVAAIGLCVGAGFLYCAGLATVLVLLSLFVLNKWENYWMRNRRHHTVTVRMVDGAGVFGFIADRFDEAGIRMISVKMSQEKLWGKDKDAVPGGSVLHARFSLKAKEPKQLLRSLDQIRENKEILSVEVSPAASALNHPAAKTAFKRKRKEEKDDSS